MKRFLSLERRLQRNPDVYKKYREFIEEYQKLGHLSELPLNEVDPHTLNFLPHHEVVKLSSSTTKLRVVFDGSAKTSSGISINDCQLMGPTVQKDLFSLLLNFRQHQVAITGDVEKMYRQIVIVPKHRKYQCILWRSNITQKVQFLQLNTDTYGLKCSSYLATKCLQTVGMEGLSRFPEASSRIINDFYMDDFVSGADSPVHAKQLIGEVSQMLSEAGLLLRKLRSSHTTVVNSSLNVETILNLPNTESKTLGIQWNSSSDVFLYTFHTPSNATVKSKRQLLSFISKIYDPLGLLSPIIIRAKLLVQSLWKLQLSWDEEIPASFSQEWNNFSSALMQTPSLSIPRCIFRKNVVQTELHGFCDASSRAYGACIYIRSIFNDYSESHLLCSKSRVAHLKQTTIPRLELSAAVLLTELVSKVVTVLSYKFSRKHFWSDSKIVLGWINSTPNNFKTFVANRIAYILENTDPINWHHCPSKENPSDLISRGSSIETLAANLFWLHGPQFLQSPHIILQKNLIAPELELPEIKTLPISLHCVNDDNFLNVLISKHSLLSKLQRILAFVLRIAHNMRSPRAKRDNGPLKVSELSKALLKLVAFCQRSCLSSEIKLLKNENRKLLKNSHLSSLQLFLDEEGLVRVGGRIRNSNLSYDKIHPLLLPNNHALTTLIIRHYHVKYLHCGANQLLSVVRNRFWQIAGRITCRQIVHKCVVCFRANPRFHFNIMGNLPSSRVSIYAPCFTETGVDFAGPILIKDRYTRNPKLIKAYLALFICMTTRAVHLELVTSLSSQAFIETFKRFISRRGRPRRMHSDNATNFITAANELKNLYLYLEQKSVQSELSNYLAAETIDWNFIPPSSPHFGGLWEANIKSTKRHLLKILKSTNLNYEALHTLLIQIESVLNSRPLGPLSSDPNDFQILTPFHFLLGHHYAALPEPPLENLPVNRLDSFQRRQQLLQHFWKRWHQEVLPEMQRRIKWPLARVTELHPGDDGKIRVVSLRSSSGKILKRPIVKMCALPIDDDGINAADNSTATPA